MAVYLSLAASAAVSGIFTSASRQSTPVFLEVLEQNASGSPDSQGRLEVEAIVLDGRTYKWHRADPPHGWAVDALDNLLLGTLVYKRNAEPAVLTFNARRFVAVLDAAGWSGLIRFTHNGRTSDKEVRLAGGQKSVIVLEDPSPTTGSGALVVAMVVLAGCIFAFGPIKPGRSRLIWLVFFLGTLHLLYWLVQVVATSPDSVGYFEDFSKNFIHGYPAYFPPGYGGFLSFVGLIAGRNLGAWTTAVQHMMVVGGAICLYLLLRDVVADDLALLGGGLAGALAPMLTAPQTAMSETPTSFAMICAFFCAVRAGRRIGGKRIALAIIAGMLAGFGVIIRVSPIAGLLPAFCCIYLAGPWREGLRSLAITISATVFVVLLPIGWCWHHSGNARLTNSSGVHLFDRIVTEQKLIDEDGPATQKLQLLLQGQDLRKVPLSEIMAHAGLSRMSFDEKVTLAGDVAIEGLIANPWQYLVRTPQIAWREFIEPTGALPAWAITSTIQPDFENAPLLPFAGTCFRWRETVLEINAVLWPILCTLAMVGVILGLVGYRRSFSLALAGVPAGVLGLTAAVEVLFPRYNAPVVPFVCMSAMLPLNALPLLWKRLTAKRSKLASGAVATASASADTTDGRTEPVIAKRGIIRRLASFSLQHRSFFRIRPEIRSQSSAPLLSSTARSAAHSSLPSTFKGASVVSSEKTLSENPNSPNFSRVIAGSAIAVSLLEIIFFAAQGITVPYSIAAIAVAVFQIFFSIRYLKTVDAGLPGLLVILYVVQSAMFLAKPLANGPEPPLRLLQVAIIAIILATALAAPLVAFRLLKLPLAIGLCSLVAIGLVIGEVALSLASSNGPATKTADVSRIVPEMKDIAGPAGLKVVQSKVAVDYRGDPNGSFKEINRREIEWVFSVVSPDEARLVLPRENPDSVRVEITKAATDVGFHVQLRKENFRIKANTKYLLSFRARADKPRTMVAGFGKAHGDWGNLGLFAQADLKPKWQDFSFDFIGKSDDDNACVHLNLGGNAAAVEIAGVHLRNLSDNTPADPAIVVPGTYTVTYNFNSEGCRGPEYSAPKPNGPKRILLLGDSFVLGAGIPEESTVSSQLERLLNAEAPANSPPKYQVINCGQSGYGTHDERLFYELLGADYRPDLVLTGVTWQDDVSVWEQQSPPAMGRFESLFFTLRALRGHLNSGPHTDFTRCVQELRQLEGAAQKRGANVGVFLFRNNADYSGSTQSGKTWNQLTKTITEGLRETKIPVLDTGKVLTQGNADDLKAHAAIPQDANATAHAIAARELIRFLHERQLVTP